MTLKIPVQLRDMKFRFIKIRPKTKHASESNWQESYNYKYDEVSFKEYMKGAVSYGVLCGYGKLAVIDCDTEKLASHLYKELPATFRVITGSGGMHLYYLIPDLDKKIVIEDSNDVHHGEIQFHKSYVVGPGSLHPRGNYYEVRDDIKIQTITKKTLLKALEPFLKKEDKFVDTTTTGLNWDISKILENLHSIKEQREDEWWGAHPVHGSSKARDKDKNNFNLNPIKNVWHCYRHHTGGDALSLIAMLNGLVKCEDCKKGFFNSKEGKEIFRKAKNLGMQKYAFEDNRLKLFGSKSRRGELLVQNIVEYLILKCKFITVRDATGRLPHIYAYQDGYYKLNGEDLLVQHIKEIFGDQDIPYKIRYKNEILDYIKTENVVERDNINPPKNLLNLNNGVYDVKIKKLLSHDPKYYFLYKIPWDYSPKAKCPKVLKYLKSTLKTEFITLTQEIFGYCMMFDYRHAAIFYLYGTGGNGKKIWAKILQEMLGSMNVSNKSIDSLIRHRFTSALLYGKLANICGELTSTVLKDTDLLKSLSAGDPIQAEFKGKDGFDFENKAKIITACNKVPYCIDLTYGWYDRQYIIPFLKKFRHSDQEDTELLDKLLVKKEMEGLLMWSLKGMHRLLKNKRFSYPQDKKARYLMYQQNTEYFVRKFYKKTIDMSDILKTNDIYEDYRKWCEENDVPLDSKNALGRSLTYAKFPQERITEKGQQTYIDIRRYIKKVEK